MANSVREFVIESLRGFYERLPLKKVAIDGSVLTPDASGIVNINAVSQEEFTSAALATAAALNDLNDKIEDSTLYVKYPEFEDAAMTTAAALNVLNARTQDISSYVTRNELEEVELSTAMALNDLDVKVEDTSFKNSVLEENIDDIRLDITDLSTSISYINSSIAIIDASISALDASISALDASVKRIDASVKIIDASVKRIDTSINRIDTSVRDMSTYIADISTRVDDNELIVASALSDLDSRIEDVSSRIGDITADLMTNVTYSELKALRDSSSLVPGMQYRITDYHTSVKANHPELRSADHQFDIVVTALSENIFSEDANAIWHDGDTYFKDCDLPAWKLKYSFDNDTDRFLCKSKEPPEVVLYDGYFVLDGMDSSCQIDGSVYYLYKCVNCGVGSNATYGFLTEIPEIGDDAYGVYYNSGTGEYELAGYSDSESVTNVLPGNDDEGTGWIYEMTDEFGNTCDYDFKNIQFLRYYTYIPRSSGNGNYCAFIGTHDLDYIFEYSYMSDHLTNLNFHMDTSTSLYLYTFSGAYGDYYSSVPPNLDASLYDLTIKHSEWPDVFMNRNNTIKTNAFVTNADYNENQGRGNLYITGLTLFNTGFTNYPATTHQRESFCNNIIMNTQGAVSVRWAFHNNIIYNSTIYSGMDYNGVKNCEIYDSYVMSLSQGSFEDNYLNNTLKVRSSDILYYHDFSLSANEPENNLHVDNVKNTAFCDSFGTYKYIYDSSIINCKGTFENMQFVNMQNCKNVYTVGSINGTSDSYVTISDISVNNSPNLFITMDSDSSVRYGTFGDIIAAFHNINS